MAEPERILIQSRRRIYSHNFILPDYLPMIFDTHSQEALICIPIVLFFFRFFVATFDLFINLERVFFYLIFTPQEGLNFCFKLSQFDFSFKDF